MLRMAQHITALFTAEKRICNYSDLNVGASDFAFSLVCIRQFCGGEKPGFETSKQLLKNALVEISGVNSYNPDITPTDFGQEEIEDEVNESEEGEEGDTDDESESESGSLEDD